MEALGSCLMEVLECVADSVVVCFTWASVELREFHGGIREVRAAADHRVYELANLVGKSAGIPPEFHGIPDSGHFF